MEMETNFIMKSVCSFNVKIVVIMVVVKTLLLLLSSENLQGSKLGSNDRFWFIVVMLGIIFKF
jgi:hypothetical protein